MSQQIFREVERGNLVAVKKLLSSNPGCVNIQNPGENRTPLHVASWHGFDHIVKELLGHGARYEAQDRFGNTALHLACDSGSVDTVQQLLGPGRKASVRIRNREGQTPLHVAVLGGSEDVVKELMLAGAKTDAKDKEGHTPVDYVPEHFESLLEVLTSHDGAKPRGTSLGNSELWKNVRQSPRPLSARKNSRLSVSPEPKFSHNGTPRHRGQTTINSARNSRNTIQQKTTREKSLSRESTKTITSKAPSKTLQMQDLQRDLKDLTSRLDMLEDTLAQNKDESGDVQVEIDAHDRQLAELDQRLSLHESHLREVRPQVQELGKDVRRAKEQYDHFQWAVQSWRETVQGQMDTVTNRLKNLESEEGQRSHKDDSNKQQNEKEMEALTQATQQLQNALDNNTELQRTLSDLRSRLTRIEASTVASTANKDKDAGVALGQITEVSLTMEKLQAQLEWTAKRADRVEKLYSEQLETQLSRKTEQEKELSERESKILDLRRMALEEENHRRQLCEVQEEHKTKMHSLEQKVEALLGLIPGSGSQLKETPKADSKAENQRLAGRIRELEGQIDGLRAQLAQQQTHQAKAGCCSVS